MISADLRRATIDLVAAGQLMRLSIDCGVAAAVPSIEMAMEYFSQPGMLARIAPPIAGYVRKCEMLAQVCSKAPEDLLNIHRREEGHVLDLLRDARADCWRERADLA